MTGKHHSNGQGRVVAGRWASTVLTACAFVTIYIAAVVALSEFTALPSEIIGWRITRAGGAIGMFATAAATWTLNPKVVRDGE